jgi:hypothetical protein
VQVAHIILLPIGTLDTTAPLADVSPLSDFCLINDDKLLFTEKETEPKNIKFSRNPAERKL